MKKKYDLVLGFGPACSCSQMLRLAKLQLLSFPFDWIGPQWGVWSWDSDVRRKADMLVSGFSKLLNEEDFRFRGNHDNGKADYFNDRLGYIFLHDFPQSVPRAESFPAVAAKYRRREKRLVELIGRSKKVLVARLDRPDLDYRTPDDDCRYARETLSKAFPSARFDFLLVQQDASIPFGRRRLETVEPGFFRLRFDYLDRRPGADRKQPRTDLTSAAVAKLFSVRDYRTKEEIAAHREKKRREHLTKRGGESSLLRRWRRFISLFRKDASPASS